MDAKEALGTTSGHREDAESQSADISIVVVVTQVFIAQSTLCRFAAHV